MKNYLYLSALVLWLAICTSCANAVQNWRSDIGPGSNAISFKYFNGKNTDTISLASGDELLIKYKAVANTGSLSLTVHLGGTQLWRKAITQAADSAAMLTAGKSGKYKIELTGKQASGSFELLYKRVRPKHIKVAMNKNIELFGLMLQLDNGPDVMYSKDSVTVDGKRVSIPAWYVKTCDNYRRYKQLDSCAMMKLYRDEMARGVYNDFFIGFLLEVDEVPFAGINAGTSDAALLGFSPKGDIAEAKKNATAFLDMMNDFYKQVNFDQYLKDNAPYYAMAKANVQKSLPPANFIPVMERFYQQQFNGYYLIPSLNIPSGMGFGKMNTKTRIVYNTFGPFTVQSYDAKHQDVGYDQPEHIRGLSVHEFGHSFVNPAIDMVPDSLIRSSAYLYLPIKDRMTKLSYPRWRISLYEHFVRAGEVVIARNLGDPATAEKILSENVKSGFIYLPAIVAELEKYNHEQGKYPSYSGFVPLVLERLKAQYPEKHN